MDIFGKEFEIKEVPIERWKNTETKWIIRRKVFGLWWSILNEYDEFATSSWPDQYSATRYLVDYLGMAKFEKKIKSGQIRVVKHKPYPEGMRILEFSGIYRLIKGFYIIEDESSSIVFVGEHDELGDFENTNELIMKAELSGYSIDNKIEFDGKCENKDPYSDCISVIMFLR